MNLEPSHHAHVDKKLLIRYTSVTNSFWIRPKNKYKQIVSKLFYCIVILFHMIFNHQIFILRLKYWICQNFAVSVYDTIYMYIYVNHIHVHEYRYIILTNCISSGFSFLTPLRDQSWPFLPKSKSTTELHVSVTATW